MSTKNITSKNGSENQRRASVQLRPSRSSTKPVRVESEEDVSPSSSSKDEREERKKNSSSKEKKEEKEDSSIPPPPIRKGKQRPPSPLSEVSDSDDDLPRRPTPRRSTLSNGERLSSNEEDENSTIVISSKKDLPRLDSELKKLHFTFKIALRLEGDDGKKRTHTLIAQTPIGDMVGVKMDVEGLVVLKPSQGVAMTQASGKTSKMPSSRLASISGGSDESSISICGDEVVLLEKDNSGQIKSTTFLIGKDQKVEQLSGILITCPLIKMSEIQTLSKTSGFQKFLYVIHNDAVKINNRLFDTDFKSLQANINFLEGIVGNMKVLAENVSVIKKGNDIEKEATSEKVQHLLKKASSEEKNIEELHSQLDKLNFNFVQILTGLHQFNNLRPQTEELDRTTMTFYFNMYVRALLSLSDKRNNGIRSPSTWGLDIALMRVKDILESKNSSICISTLKEELQKDIKDMEIIASPPSKDLKLSPTPLDRFLDKKKKDLQPGDLITFGYFKEAYGAYPESS